MKFEVPGPSASAGHGMREMNYRGTRYGSLRKADPKELDIHTSKETMAQF